jgi:predicted SnoaL-like aldol condensation-catalyzing enzyme
MDEARRLDQLFALGNVSNWSEILKIGPYEISGDHHEQMQTVAEGNFVFAASEGTFGGKVSAFFELFRVDNGKITEHLDVMADIPAKMARGNEKF